MMKTVAAICILLCTTLLTEGLQLRAENRTDNENHTFCPSLQLLQGRDGRDGRDGAAGTDGKDGEKGEPGIQGPPGPPGPRGGGAVYTRWGRTTCPDTPGTRLLYKGRAGGSLHGHRGGSSNYICLPENPDYMEYTAGVQGYSPVHGAYYRVDGSYFGSRFGPLHNKIVPCAICHTTTRATALMIPAKTQCPESWTREYIGFLMTEYKAGNSHRTEFACVDKDPEAAGGRDNRFNGALFHFTEGTCNSLPCPPYDPQKELTCVVCTNSI